MGDTEIITATKASRQFSAIMAQVFYNNKTFYVKKGGVIIARITPPNTKSEG